MLANPDNSGSSGAGEELGICEDRTDGDVPSAPVDSDGAGEQGALHFKDISFPWLRK